MGHQPNTYRPVFDGVNLGHVIRGHFSHIVHVNSVNPRFCTLTLIRTLPVAGCICGPQRWLQWQVRCVRRFVGKAIFCFGEEKSTENSSKTKWIGLFLLNLAHALPFPTLLFLVSSPSRIHIPPHSSSILSEAEETGRAEEIKKSRSQRKKKMESSNCMGLVAVVAVSGSIALVALQVHRRLASDFIKKLESEIGIQSSPPLCFLLRLLVLPLFALLEVKGNRVRFLLLRQVVKETGQGRRWGSPPTWSSRRRTTRSTGGARRRRCLRQPIDDTKERRQLVCLSLFCICNLQVSVGPTTPYMLGFCLSC